MNKPVWISPDKWEDHKNGMYNSRNNQDIAIQCKKLLSKNCYNEMKQVIKEWPNATTVNLSKSVWNNKAWLGQACCSLQFGATIEETTSAWVQMTKEQRDEANKIALQVIKEWEDENI